MELPLIFTLAFFNDIGGGEVIIIGAIALLLFGKNLPTVSRNIGKTIAEFKKTVSEASSEIKKEMDAAAAELDKVSREAEKELPKASDFTLDDGPSKPPDTKPKTITTGSNGASGSNGSSPELPGPLNRPVASASPSALDTFKPDAPSARPPVITP